MLQNAFELHGPLHMLSNVLDGLLPRGDGN